MLFVPNDTSGELVPPILGNYTTPTIPTIQPCGHRLFPVPSSSRVKLKIYFCRDVSSYVPTYGHMLRGFVARSLTYFDPITTHVLSR